MRQNRTGDATQKVLECTAVFLSLGIEREALAAVLLLAEAAKRKKLTLRLLEQGLFLLRRAEQDPHAGAEAVGEEVVALDSGWSRPRGRREPVHELAAGPVAQGERDAVTPAGHGLRGVGASERQRFAPQNDEAASVRLFEVPLPERRINGVTFAPATATLRIQE